MTYRFISGAVLMGLLAQGAQAASLGYGSQFDPRIQKTQYNPEDVIKVMVKKGTVSLVQFAEDEKVDAIGLGDPDAWKVSVKDNSVFFRPIVEDSPDTNVAVMTNKRNYSLYLMSTKGTPTYVLRFDYPKPLKNPLFTPPDKKIPCADGGTINGKYLMRGAMDIAPYQIWDDGQFVCMRWSGAKDLPVAYRKNADGEEVLVNTHMENNTMVIHELSKDYVLRLGKQVLDVRTDSAVPRSFNYKGTSTKHVREEKSL